MQNFFPDFNLQSKVWVYQSSRELTQNEVEQIHAELGAFVVEWNAHGAKLLCDFVVLKNRFVVMCVDESIAKASGCSIDSSVHVIQQLGSKQAVNWMDKANIAFENTDGTIFTVPLADIPQRISGAVILHDTITYQNFVSNLDELRNQWRVPVKNSWLQSRFAGPSVVR